MSTLNDNIDDLQEAIKEAESTLWRRRTVDDSEFGSDICEALILVHKILEQLKT